MIIEKRDLYLSAIFFPYTVAEPLGLGPRVERRIFCLMLLMWCPAVAYAFWLIHRHYDAYVETVRQKRTPKDIVPDDDSF